MTKEELINAFDRIPSEVYRFAEEHAGSFNSFVSWIQFTGDEPVLRTFGFQQKKSDLVFM